MVGPFDPCRRDSLISIGSCVLRSKGTGESLGWPCSGRRDRPKTTPLGAENSARHLHAKYSKAGARPLAPQSLRRLDAYLDIERPDLCGA